MAKGGPRRYPLKDQGIKSIFESAVLADLAGSYLLHHISLLDADSML